MRVTHAPWNGVRVEQMSEHSSDVAQFVGFETVDGFVLLLKDGFEALHVFFLQQAKPLQQKNTDGEISHRHCPRDVYHLKYSEI